VSSALRRLIRLTAALPQQSKDHIVSNSDTANLNETTADLEQSASHIAAQQCRTTVLHALVARGVETGIRDSTGYTSLYHATSQGSLETMRALVGSDSHAVDDGSLHIAARTVNPDQVSLLMQCGHGVC
jgi:ankyrin repeat protein